MTTEIMPDERANVDLAKVWLPGFHYGVSFAEYRSLPYLNASTLCWANASALHLKAALSDELKHKESDDLVFGSAMHARILEPDMYHERYVVAPGCQAVLQSGKAKGAYCGKTSRYLIKGEWLCGTHTPKALIESGLIERQRDILSVDQAQRVEGAAKAVERDKIVRLIRMPGGGFEATILFEWDGIKCKARLDKYLPRSQWNPQTIVDLKKTGVGRADDNSVERAAWEYAYDVKASFYVKAVEQVTGDAAVFVWVYVEDGPPYGVNVIQADDDTLNVGMIRLQDCFSKYRRGIKTGEWPGYMDGQTQPKMGGLPAWAKAKYLGR